MILLPRGIPYVGNRCIDPFFHISQNLSVQEIATRSKYVKHLALYWTNQLIKNQFPNYHRFFFLIAYMTDLLSSLVKYQLGIHLILQTQNFSNVQLEVYSLAISRYAIPFCICPYFSICSCYFISLTLIWPEWTFAELIWETYLTVFKMVIW